MYIPEYIEKLKEGYIFVAPNGRTHFKHLFSDIEKRQNEHENIKYVYASMIFKDDKEKSIAILKELIEKGHEPAMHIYGMLLLKGEHIERDKAKGMELMVKSSDSGYALASYALSLAYFNGDFDIERDLDKAFIYAEKSASQGYNVGYFQMGRIYTEKEACVDNLEKAVTYFEKVDMEKYHKKHIDLIIYAYNRLAKAYLNGELGSEKNEALSKKYSARAEEIFKAICDDEE